MWMPQEDSTRDGSGNAVVNPDMTHEDHQHTDDRIADNEHQQNVRPAERWHQETTY
jgi:hypothetical protein